MPAAGTNASSQQPYEEDEDYNDQEMDFLDDAEEEEDEVTGRPSGRGRGSPHDRLKAVLNKPLRQAHTSTSSFLKR